MRHACGMEKAEHGRRLAAAMSARGVSRATLATALEVNVRTVTNWTSGQTMPSPAQRAGLRAWVGEYDARGDEVERALANSGLTEDRQYAVLEVYKRKLREQREDKTA